MTEQLQINDIVYRSQDGWEPMHYSTDKLTIMINPSMMHAVVIDKDVEHDEWFVFANSSNFIEFCREKQPILKDKFYHQHENPYDRDWKAFGVIACLCSFAAVAYLVGLIIK